MKRLFAILSLSALLISCTEQQSQLEIQSDKFVLQSGEYSLNAVYTYVDDNESHPVVLIIAGSGPSDCDSTIGSLKPLADIAEGLAHNGINSLRVDKRTENYGAAFANGGIEEEYLIDCRTALEYIKDIENIGDIYLLGHSFGGQIAPILANEDESIKGIILFNSSARHLAVIACEQCIAVDSANEESYIMYRDMAVEANANNSQGYYYYGATDYYWASYNKYDTIQNMQNIDIPILIINSTYDTQCFQEDIDLWKSSFGDSDRVEIYVDDKISHLGYELDLTKYKSILNDADFPDRIIELFKNFIINNIPTDS